MTINELYFYKIYRRNTRLFLMLLITVTILVVSLLCYSFLKEAYAYPIEIVGTKRRDSNISAMYFFSAATIVLALFIASLVIIPNHIALKRAKNMLNVLSDLQLEQLQITNHDSTENNSRYTYVPGYMLIHYLFNFRVVDLTQTKTLKLSKVTSYRNRHFRLGFADSRGPAPDLAIPLYQKEKVRHIIYLVQRDQPHIQIINEGCLYY